MSKWCNTLLHALNHTVTIKYQPNTLFILNCLHIYISMKYPYYSSKHKVKTNTNTLCNVPFWAICPHSMCTFQTLIHNWPCCFLSLSPPFVSQFLEFHYSDSCCYYYCNQPVLLPQHHNTHTWAQVSGQVKVKACCSWLRGRRWRRWRRT